MTRTFRDGTLGCWAWERALPKMKNITLKRTTSSQASHLRTSPCTAGEGEAKGVVAQLLVVYFAQHTVAKIPQDGRGRVRIPTTERGRPNE
jgi:hypothetical protein